MDSVRAGPFGQLFRPDNFIFGILLILKTKKKNIFRILSLSIQNFRSYLIVVKILFHIAIFAISILE